MKKWSGISNKFIVSIACQQNCYSIYAPEATHYFLCISLALYIQNYCKILTITVMSLP